MENRPETIVAKPSQIYNRFAFTEIPRSVQRRKRAVESQEGGETKHYRYRVRGNRGQERGKKQKSRTPTEYHSVPPAFD